jgi:hypothetical protein
MSLSPINYRRHNNNNNDKNHNLNTINNNNNNNNGYLHRNYRQNEIPQIVDDDHYEDNGNGGEGKQLQHNSEMSSLKALSTSWLLPNDRELAIRAK